ncbi:zinc-ribbon domain containing protein [Patescibacteria group bacterium]|nr:zinc-ribbon domain containing protein [Patescibacteria group bacterium]
MPELTITCRECGNEFVWTEGEQEFYKEKSLQKPVICPICRAKKKAEERQFAPYKSKKKS